MEENSDLKAVIGKNFNCLWLLVIHTCVMTYRPTFERHVLVVVCASDMRAIDMH
jgi:hypothetical protein